MWFNIKNGYVNKLDDQVNKYNITYHITIKVKVFDVNSSTYINFDVQNNDKDPKFEVDDCVRILKFKGISAK